MQDITYICGECGHAARNVLPVACPVCHSGPARFTLIDKQLIETTAAQEGPVSEEESFDGVKVKWTEDAKKLLWTMTDAYARRRAKARIEKMARVQRLPAVTVDFANPIVQETIGDLSALHTNATLPPTTDDLKAVPEQAEPAGTEPPQEGAPAELTEATPITWTDEARQRVALVPEGFMREMTEDLILTHAAEQQANIITLAIAEAGIELAKDEMVKMVEAKLARQQKKEQKHKTISPANGSGSCPVPHESAHDSLHGSNAGAGVCPVPHGAAPALLASVGQPAFTEAAREHIDTLAQRSESSGKATAERATTLVENLSVQRAERKGLNEVTPEFIAMMGKKLGYGHPASEKTYELDFVWTPEALAKLEEVPDFCRELTRWRVEWTAYKKNLGRLITPDAMDVKYGLWGEVSEHIRERQELRLPWTNEAESRLEKVPDFVKGQVIQSVEGNARQMGYAEVNNAVLDRVIEKWRTTGDFHEGQYGYK